jgi:hypothetical protein
MTDAAAVSDRSHTFDIDMSTRGPWSWLATGRYGVRPAPNGLALVQDFLNTRASTLTGPDMLCDNATANGWAAHAVRAWPAQRGAVCEPPTLTAHDADKLRDVRNTLDSTLAAVPAVGARHPLGPAEFTITNSSELLWTPTGRGWQWYFTAPFSARSSRAKTPVLGADSNGVLAFFFVIHVVFWFCGGVSFLGNCGVRDRTSDRLRGVPEIGRRKYGSGRLSSP